MERVDHISFIHDLYKKYGSGEGKASKIPPSVYLNKYAEDTKISFIEGVFTSPFSLNKRGVGKSVYCLKTLYYVYDKNVDEALRHIVFLPQHFLSLFKTAIDKNIRIRMIVWDDAGFWIGSQRWQSKFTRAIREFLNVIRTHVITIMINAPSLREVARGIRDNLDVIGFVRIHDHYFDNLNRRSIIYLYDTETWSMRQRRTYPPPLVSWIFKQYLEWYPRYDEMRRQYVEIGVKRAEESLKYISEESARELEEIVKSYEFKPNDLSVEREISIDDLTESEEEELIENELGDYM
ncbi:MAG: hypothetical protein QW584_03720 [Thermofilaceae archaeon]